MLRALATSGSVAGAAASLHLSPPAVSQQLRVLEREVGAELLDRSGRQVTLTAAGRLLVAHAERIAAQLRQAEAELAELTGRVAGPVRIAAFQSVMAVLVAPALRRLAQTHPAIRPSVVERYGPPALAALRRGDLDIVLTEYDTAAAQPQLEGLRLRRLFVDPYRLIVPPDWPAGLASVADLAGRPWVAGPPDTACDHALRRLAAEAGIPLAIEDVCVEFPSVLALVAAGRGAAVVPSSTVDTSVRVTPASIGGRQVGAYVRAGNRHPDPATRSTLDILSETAAR